MPDKLLWNMHITTHAQERLQQRGISSSDLQTLLTHANKRSHIEDGCQSWRISKQHAEKLTKQGAIASSVVERLAKIAAVVTDINTEKASVRVITVLHQRAGRRGRPYRRD